MSSIIIEIPVNEINQTVVNLNYIHKAINGDCGVFSYFQGLRSGTLRMFSSLEPEETNCAKMYHAMLSKNLDKFSKIVPTNVDVLLTPPSCYPEHAKPYLEIAKLVSPSAIDLTSAFDRKKNSPKAGAKDTSLEEVISSLKYSPCGDEKHFKSLLIVDDIFSHGKTTYSLLIHLREAGMTESCTVTVACPLWIKA